MTEVNFSYADIEAAAERLDGKAVRTPLLESPALNERLGGRLLVKAEPLQVTGSFKFRGAYNAINQLSPQALERGVIAFSSGNHALGVAAAAYLHGAPAVIVMPEDAPAVKLDGARRWGAEIVPYDRSDHDAREGIAAEIGAERGLSMIKPFDAENIMAGQGTVGRELCQQAEAIGAGLDAVLSPVGGGGLTAGVSTAVKQLSPETEIYGVEPENFDDLRRSLLSGERETIAISDGSFCDALLAPSPGAKTFAVMQRNLKAGLVVSDAEVAAAMRLAYLHLKLVIEPGGAVALAAALSGKFDCLGQTVAIIASGGNVDPALYAGILGEAEN